ncbi:MAG: hypothetical protein AAGA86_03915 [Bacteroidota bacterium]
MPANPKYLSSGWKRFSKVMAAVLGGYAASTTIFVAVAVHSSKPENALFSTTYGSFLLWGIFMVMVYWVNKAWISWSVILLITVLSVLSIAIAP